MQAKQKLLLFFFFVFLTYFAAGTAQAICPVCTVAVAGGLGLSHYLGIDDFITAIWVGGLCLSITAWCWNYLKKKGKLTIVTGFFVLFLVYFSALLPVYKLNYIGISANTIGGVDKIILGTAAGTIVFWAGALTNSLLKKRHGGKVYFPLQKVALPLGLLLIASLAYYVYCKCYNIF